MEVTNTMGAAEVLRKYLLEADPDLVRSMVQTFAEALMSAEALGIVQCRIRRGQPRAGELAQRLSNEALGHEGRHHRPRHPEITLGGATSPTG